MSRRHDVQDGTGRMEYLPGRGTLVAHGVGVRYAPSGNPVNGDAGFAPGCVFTNPLGGGVWVNLGTFTSAFWVREDPSSAAQGVFGGSSLVSPAVNFGTFRSGGNLYANCGNPIAQNGADANDDILDGFVLPAGAFDIANRGLTMTFAGATGATGNNKRVKIWLNPTMTGQTVSALGVISGGRVTATGTGVLLLDSGVQTGNAAGWVMIINLFKLGVAGANTQVSAAAQFIFGTTHGGTTAPAFPTQTESAAWNFVVTGSSPTSSAAGDIVLNWSEVFAMN